MIQISHHEDYLGKEKLFLNLNNAFIDQHEAAVAYEDGPSPVVLSRILGEIMKREYIRHSAWV